MHLLFDRFEWDDRSLTYKRVRRSVMQTLRTIPKVFLWGLGSGIISVPLGYSYWERLFLKRIQNETEKLRAEIRRFSQEVGNINSRQTALYERLQKFYRPLIGLSPLPSGEWGGMGGAPTLPEEVVLYRSRRLLTEYQELEKQFAEANARLTRIPCILPVRGAIVSGFGFRNDPFTRQWRMHTGIDINARTGTPVCAAAAGKVIYAGWDNGGYGIQVEIDHFNGIVTKYAHLSRVAVQVGDTVLRGHVIGYVGSTGYSTAPHLHYEVIENGVKVDPQKYIYLP